MRGIVGGLLAVALVASACSGDDGGGSGTAAAAGAPIDACDWPMWGYSPERTFATACDDGAEPGHGG